MLVHLKIEKNRLAINAIYYQNINGIYNQLIRTCKVVSFQQVYVSSDLSTVDFLNQYSGRRA